MKTNNGFIYTIIIGVSALFFLPFLGSVHLFDWDEINFAEAAREMIVTGDYLTVQINYERFWEKPPLFIWLQTLSMEIFGVNEFAARLPNAITGIISLSTLFYLGRQLKNKSFGILWTLTYFGSFLPHFYYNTGIIDPVFNFFMFLGVYNLFQYYSHSSNSLKYTVWAGLFIGLAVLTKGPVGYLLPVLTWVIFHLLYINKKSLPFKVGTIVTGLALLISLGWYGVDLVRHGPWFIKSFIEYQIRLLTTAGAGHGGPIYYHIVVLLIGCFPASLFCFSYFKQRTVSPYFFRQFNRWMILLLFVVLGVFTIVQTKIIHYSSLAYYPITFLAAYQIYQYIYQQKKYSIYLLLSIALIGVCFGIIFTLLPLIGKHPEIIKPYINDPFAKANLEAQVHWSGWESLIGVFYIFVVLLSIGFFYYKTPRRGSYTLFLGTATTLFFVLVIFIPKIEKYKQGAPIAFYKKMQDKKCYVEVLGFKSYAHLYYRKRPPANAPSNVSRPGNHSFKQWLLKGDIDKEAYFICKNIHADKYRKREALEIINIKNGFVFFKRTP